MQEIDPKVKIRYKDSNHLPWYNRFCFWVATLINPAFMTRYVTVVGSTIYFPTEEFFKDDEERTFAVLAHEMVHVYDRAMHKWKWVFNLKYAFPQILSPLCLLGFLGFLHPALFSLFALALLAFPWPAPWRVKYERRGYAMTAFVLSLQHRQLDRDHVIKQFNTRAYYWMSWSKSSTNRWLDDVEDDVRNRVLSDPLRIEVFNVYHEV